MTAYRTIVADPPWPYVGPGMPGTGGRGKLAEGSAGMRPTRFVDASARYGLMSVGAICDLRPPAEDNAHLYLWTTNAFMDEAYDVARAWGFAPKTILTWGKVQPDGRPSMKTGYYFRGATEHCLFAVRGSLPLQTEEALPTLWLWPRLGHSVKPDAFYDLVEKCSPEPRLEMFSRRSRFFWDTWGDEALQHVEIPA